MNDFGLAFIGVGAAKAGTSWLAAGLDEHPQVCLPKSKGLSYFCTKQIRPNVPVNHDKGDHWLRARFSHSNVGQIRGEISVSYLVDPKSPTLIKDRFPDVKIIISYRNPVDSLYTLYYQIGKEFPIPDTFETFLEKQPHFIQTGMYFTHTRRYLEHFPLENFHFILYDDICSDPKQVISDLYQFLGVEADFLPKSLHKRVNVRKVARSALLRDFIGNARDLLNSNPGLLRFKRLLIRLGLERISHQIYAANLRSSNYRPMRMSTRSRLLEIYGEEILLLGELLKRNLGHWNELSPHR